MNDSQSAPRADLSGRIAFRQHVLPRLQMGRYAFKVKHEVVYTDKSTSVHQKETSVAYPAERSVIVSCNRFALAEGDVKSQYPPHVAAGNFGLTLPHVVLTRRDLPWLWSAETMNVGRDPHQTGNVAPWLALIAFTLDAPVPEERSRQAGSLRVPEPGVLCYPGLELFDDEPEDLPIKTIDVPVGLFNAVAPAWSDLQYLAHTHLTEAESRALKSSDPENRHEEYAIIVANRLPATEKTVVHLVCLAGMKDYLPGPAQKLPPGTAAVRLVSLESWNFLTLEPSQDFQYLVANTLDVGRGDPCSLTLPIQAVAAPTAEDQAVHHALALGYTALPHDNRFGDKTVSWYRGPLVPYRVATKDTFPVPNIDALTRYDDRTGIFDVSYAAAWQLGRLLALRDKELAVALYNWKINSQVEQIQAFEQAVLTDALDAGLAGPLRARRARAAGGAAADITDTLLDLLAARTGELLDRRTVSRQTPSSRSGARSGWLHVDPGELVQALTAPPAEARREVRDAGAPPGIVKEWLSRLRLLQGVPYPYLVPDERMLPPESLRFVHLDRNWVNALTDGALSIGRVSESILAHDRRSARSLDHQAWVDSAHVRSRLLKIHAPRHLPGAEDLSGFLMHSSVVADYPGLEVVGWDAGGRELEIFHFERIDPNVLLCLFAGLVQDVRFMGPSEGITFKVDHTPSLGFCKTPLRKLEPDYGPLPDKQVQIPFRPAAPGVIDVTELSRRLAAALGAPEHTFSSLELSLQMVEVGNDVLFSTRPPAHFNRYATEQGAEENPCQV